MWLFCLLVVVVIVVVVVVVVLQVYKSSGDCEVKTIQDLLDKFKSKALNMTPLGN